MHFNSGLLIIFHIASDIFPSGFYGLCYLRVVSFGQPYLHGENNEPQKLSDAAIQALQKRLVAQFNTSWHLPFFKKSKRRHQTASTHHIRSTCVPQVQHYSAL
jgi:hypothetical protein